MFRLLLSLLLILLFVGSGCAWWVGRPEVAGVTDYVDEAVDELKKGHVKNALERLMEARGRFPRDEAVLRWSAEVQRMRWRFDEAVALLLELSRAESLRSLSRREIAGQIGDLLFSTGEYSRSLSFLLSGRTGPMALQREAKGQVTLGLPFVRPQIDYRSVELALVDSAWPTVLCDLNGKPRRCVVDTGSTMCTFSKSLAKEIGIRGVRDFGMIRDSLGRSSSSSIGILDNLTIAGIELGSQPVLVVDDWRLAMRGPFGGPANPPMAILGLDVLLRFRMSLDHVKKTLQLERPRGLTVHQSEECLLIERCLLLPVKIDSVKMWFIVDTAATHTSLTEAGLQALPGGVRRAVPDYRRMKSLAGPGVISRKVGGIVVQTGPVTFTGVELPIIDRASNGFFPVHGVLGVDLIRHCRMTVDRGRILIERVGSTAVSDKR